MNYYDKMAKLNELKSQSAHARRICAEITFCAYMSSARGGRYDAQIEKALTDLLLNAEKEGVLTEKAAEAAETALIPLSKEAKAYKVHLVAHAHIDMNWLWGYEETASVTVGTFRTMLALLDRYPQFTFSQSQASTYEILEKYASELLNQVAARVKEGRWELSGSTWVENDENMPCAESFARHLLYTRRFYTRVFGKDVRLPEIDFAPDTFGHNASLPDLCAAGGVKWMYHCRGGSEGENLYIWKGKSGAELLCFCDPDWYAAEISDTLFNRVPGVCEKYGVKSWLSVYGVGDHGGGPSARDIETIIEYQSYPLFPTLVFSSYRAFFTEIEPHRASFPVLTGERNHVFSGCYTSKSETKRQNAAGEARLYEAEALSALAEEFAHTENDASIFEKAWQKLLFIQFHDILPGSGVRATSDAASGAYQEVAAAASCRADNAMRSIASQISIPTLDDGFQGGGSGYGIGSNGTLSVHTGGGGKRRAYCIFNQTAKPFGGVCRLTVWNWDYDPGRAFFENDRGQRLVSSLQNAGSGFWGHGYKEFLVNVSVPALGYTTVFLDEAQRSSLPPVPTYYNRVIEYPDDVIVLENDRVRALIDRKTAILRTLTDKETGKEFPVNARFRLSLEDGRAGMTAWKEGFPLSDDDLNETCVVRAGGVEGGALSSSFAYELSFGAGSKLNVRFTLDKGETMLRCAVNVQFFEKAYDRLLPHLGFLVDRTEIGQTCRYGVPVGTIDRPALPHDVPAFFACPTGGEGRRPALFALGKYGFSFDEKALSLTLLRASGDPDPLPEYGSHGIFFALSLSAPDANALLDDHDRFLHPLCTCPASGGGRLPTTGALAQITGARLIAVKRAEDGTGTVFRFTNAEEKQTTATLVFCRAIASASLLDVHERPQASLISDGDSVSFPIKPHEIVTLSVQ